MKIMQFTHILDQFNLNNCRSEITTCGMPTQIRVNIWFLGEFVWTQRCTSATEAETVIEQKRNHYLKQYHKAGRLQVA